MHRPGDTSLTRTDQAGWQGFQVGVTYHHTVDGWCVRKWAGVGKQASVLESMNIARRKHTSFVGNATQGQLWLELKHWLRTASIRRRTVGGRPLNSASPAAAGRERKPDKKWLPPSVMQRPGLQRQQQHPADVREEALVHARPDGRQRAKGRLLLKIPNLPT